MRPGTAGVLVVCAALAGGVLALPASIALPGDEVERPDCATYRFDPAAWEKTTGRPSPAARQGRALAECRVLLGMSRSEVRGLLGNPTESDAGTFSYELGPDALGVDSEYLDVRFRDGAAIRASVESG